ncbi:CpsD/CapB family tyrosine-protein kinase [Paenibacillus contaminans]|uniref:non-specific protein-tyrosine kinase n=1 Tax=Paenibacillus contaminans TaxID=450362 RepID=A0A329MQD8_9BACL|nr:CpsD/CapB family tyrosine-protein kinase [Paenibacillus contaminans]RAV21648.1 capsular biosynthesis protein [Paenibacillus contaminans]
MPQQTPNRTIITHANPKSPVSEAYRTLRTNIEYSGIYREIKVIMVTSTQPGEGKSTTSVNLAAAFAQADKKVLVIDADLRKPTLHHYFMKSNRVGLTGLLTDESVKQKAIMETDVEGLSVLTSGLLPPNPSEVLGSRKMDALLEKLRREYDIIVIDTPPTLAVTDSQIMSSKSDGVLLVIDSCKVKRDLAIKTLSNLKHVNARVLGVVLNNLNRKDAESYYYYFSES